MTVTPVTSDSLKRRAKYLLHKSRLPGRGELAREFLYPAMSFARVALIGGALRDLCFISVDEFCSDLDFVLEVHDKEAFSVFLEQSRPVRNNFGGYRANLGKLCVDFWVAQESWASCHGYRQVNCLEDVVNTTFFNIDSLMYIVSDDKLVVGEKTLQMIANKLLDINLEENPNPAGSAVRALRRMWRHDLWASGKLVSYIGDRIEEYGWERLVDIDRRAYPSAPVLCGLFEGAAIDRSYFVSALTRHHNKLRKSSQYELF